MARPKTPSGLIMPRLQWPVTMEQAELELDELKKTQPGLFLGPPGQAYLRGIDFYLPSALPTVYQQALNSFYAAHKRMPDLIGLPQIVDYYFAIKFFSAVPIAPNPSDKLNASAYLSPDLLAGIALPKRPWTSDDWRLPDDDAVPPGRYFYKFANGSTMHEEVVWPPTRNKRMKLEDQARRWAMSYWGLHWGEWWYFSSKPRFFLEEVLEDPSAAIVEASIFVCQGSPKLVQLRSDPKPRVALERLFTIEGKPLGGSVGGPTRKRLDRAATLPSCIDTILQAASDIGRNLFFARIDFLHIWADKPYLGEITFCPYNATAGFKPADFDLEARKMLFGQSVLSDMSKPPSPHQVSLRP